MVEPKTWADQIDDEDEDIELPPHSEVITKDGDRVVTEVRVDPDTGKRTKLIRTFKNEKRLLSKGVIERKKWTKFGQAKRDGPGPNSATTLMADEVLMQFLSGKDEIPEEPIFPKMDGANLVRCRYCKDNHFSAKCPYKDSGVPPEIMINRELLEDKKVDNESKPGIFVPPALRQGGNRRGETMGANNRKDDATIRVSNLPESMSETDMQELCNPFGKIDRIFLAKDRTTGVCKGFAFVTYQSRETATRALKMLNGYGYDHLILNVEWSKPASS